MIRVLKGATVEDIEKWKTGFTEAAPLRRNFGSTGLQALWEIDQGNEVIILGQHENRAKAQEMFASPEFRETAKRAPVNGPPRVNYLEPLLELAS